MSLNRHEVIMVEIAGKGGICHYTYNLCNEIGKKTRVLLLTSVDYELNEMKRNFDLIGIFNRFRTNPFRILLMFKQIVHQKPKALHFQLSQYPELILILCVVSKLFFNGKLAITAHNIVSHEERSYLKYVFGLLYRISDIIIVHANANKVELLELFHIPQEKIRVIPHGNYMFFNDDTEKSHYSVSLPKDNSKYILFFGYIRKYKGLIHLIRALSIIKEEVPEVKLMVVGRPIEKFSEYQKEITNLGLEKNIELNLDYVPFNKVGEYFKKADVVVLPYEKIYQSGVLQLAYGLGKPTVVTDVGGMAEVLENGKSGFVVPPADSKALAKAILRILKDKNLALEMGKYALELAKTKYSWGNIAQETLLTYGILL